MMSDARDRYMALFLQHQDNLKAYIGSLVRDRHLREDIFQDVAVILWKKFDEFDEIRSFGAWARGIASNKIMQAFARLKKNDVALSPEALDAVRVMFDQQDDTADSWVDEQLALEMCLKKLPRKSRRLIALRYDHGLKLREIANEVHSTLDAVHKALTRLRDGLRKCVERELAAVQA